MKPVWQSEIKDIEQAFGTSSTQGLSLAEVTMRQAQYGPNQLIEKKGHTAWDILVDQFKDFIVWILIGAALVSGFLKEWIDAIAIIGIVILNAILGFIQEYRAEKSLTALKKLSTPRTKVIREGGYHVIPSAELVPGDLIEIEAGDSIPADSRITWLTAHVTLHEASLTGESTPVVKTAFSLEEEEVPLADRANMLYLGTSVMSGKARAIVIDTGMKTELGKIAGMIQSIEDEQTPLQKKLEEFGKWIVYLCFALVGIVFMLGLFRGLALIEVFLTSVSLAVAAIPEGLPAVVTIALALGVQRMVTRNALIRKLPSVETLGCATVICSDKTGTLTKNEMTVQSIYTQGLEYKVTGIGYQPKGIFLHKEKPITPEEARLLEKLFLCSVLCNGAELMGNDQETKIMGDPTEAALLSCAAKYGFDKKTLEPQYPFIEEIPFDSQRKKMTMIRRNDGGYIAFVKGAPDVLLNDCTRIEEKNLIRELDARDRSRITHENDCLSNQAMRVLALAYKTFDTLPHTCEAKLIEKDLIFLGLMAMIDPPREEVKKAIEKCKTAGIKTVMITGDHKNTAVAIAKQLQFFHHDSIALSGEELDTLSEEEFLQKITHIPVYARVSPEHKLRIVRTWRKTGAIVAMTGDGVNDAPAVKEADIGVAMGITGTDVTKEVSDMVITDDNFASIVSAVEEGRGIYTNIKKFIHYLLSCNAGEILVMCVSSVIGWPLPLLPIHILWVNLITDGLPALALGVDPTDAGVMQEPPRPPHEPVISRSGGGLMFLQGAFIAFCSLLAFSLVLFWEKEGIERARTAAFIVLSCSQLFHSFNCRSFRESLFKIGITSNMQLIYATSISFALQMAVVYVPFLQKIFKTEALGLFDWVLVILISSLPLWAMEIVKRVRNR